MKYIDADLLRKEIEYLKAVHIGHAAITKETNAVDGLDAALQVVDSLQQEQPEVDLEKEIDDYLEPIKAWQIQEAPFTSMENCARHFAKWGRKQVLQEIYDGKVKPVDKITAAWIDDESKAKEE